jgi:glycosyltransferase involved in cell wall biosynthesis
MVQRSHYDVIIAEFLVMGHFLHHNPYLPAVRRIISSHGCYTSTIQKQINLSPWSLQGIKNQIRLPNTERYEFDVYRSADHILTLTPQERYNLLDRAPDLKTTVIPYGVDLDEFRTNTLPDREKSILFTGYFHHKPNCEAVRWFTRKVWPILKAKHPDLKFYIVGRSPPNDLIDLRRQDENIIVTGEVESINPYLQNSQVYVCPIRSGSGFRGKILQAMAAGIPVVSTTLGAEGFPAQTGHNMILADSPTLMAREINLLLDEPGLRDRIAANATSLIDPAYTWDTCIDELERVLHEVVI